MSLVADQRPPDDPAPDDSQPSPDSQASTTAAAERGADDPRQTALPGRVERWRRRSATGAIMSGFAFGLKEVFEPERKEPSIVQETSGDPPEDLPVDAEFDPLIARRSVVRIRPWLLPPHDDADDPDGGGGDDAEGGR